jgi:sucrose-6F-phosphate phosphohydrolase
MIILSTDLDRTLLPNGKEKYDGTLPLFFDVVKEKKLMLVYVTGRNIKLFEEARSEFKIEIPDFMIGDVGTMIYKKEDDKLVLDIGWIEHLEKNVPNWDTAVIKNKLSVNFQIRLQDESRQNKYKLSYYLDDTQNEKEVLDFIENEIKIIGVDAHVVFSVDPLENVGLIDILPRIATKATALEFLRERFSLLKESIIFCGDSGNDMLALTNGYKSILVNNALDDIKKDALRINREKGYLDNLYISKGVDRLNGNYSSGILEGLMHFGIITKDDIKN